MTWINTRRGWVTELRITHRLDAEGLAAALCWAHRDAALVEAGPPPLSATRVRTIVRDTIAECGTEAVGYWTDRVAERHHEAMRAWAAQMIAKAYGTPPADEPTW